MRRQVRRWRPWRTCGVWTVEMPKTYLAAETNDSTGSPWAETTLPIILSLSKGERNPKLTPAAVFRTANQGSASKMVETC